jgi:hypothetical protein
MSKIQYDVLSVRNSDMVKVSVTGNLNVLSIQRKTTRVSIVITIRSAPNCGKTSYWILDIWTDFNIVKAHAD